MRKLKCLFTVLLLLYNTMAFAEKVTIDDIVYDVITKAKQATVISNNVNCSKDVVIPSEITYNNVICSVTSIGDQAFCWCDSLTSIEIPNSVTSIGNEAFWRCPELTSITIGNSVTSIGDRVFEYCSGLTNITIPNSVTSIGEWVFHNCYRLESIVVDQGNTTYDSRKNCNAIIATQSNTLLYGCKNSVIPNSVTSIGEKAFYDCSGLTSITIPNSVTSIGESAFCSCSGLTSIEIPNSVTSIGNSAFSGCSGLTSITIGNSVTSIGNYAFYKCSGLTSVTIGSGVTSIGYEVFYNCENLADVYCLAASVPSTDATAFNDSYPEYMTLHVPATAINDYKTATPWSSFGTIVALNSGAGGGGGVVTTPKCADPIISYNNGALSFDCTTANAEFVSEIICDDADKYYINSINLSATYNISVYATATGYDNSNTVNATLCWIECNCNSNNDGANIISVPAKAVLITSNNGTLSINSSLDGENVEIYTTNGVLIDETTIINDNAIIQTGLAKGSVAIVKIGNKSVKVILN